jgi:hypothetical protein
VVWEMAMGMLILRHSEYEKFAKSACGRWKLGATIKRLLIAMYIYKSFLLGIASC